MAGTESAGAGARVRAAARALPRVGVRKGHSLHCPFPTPPLLVPGTAWRERGGAWPRLRRSGDFARQPRALPFFAGSALREARGLHPWDPRKARKPREPLPEPFGVSKREPAAKPEVEV